MERKTKFAIHTLVFYGLDSLKSMLQNTGAFVDKIYLSYSSVPWNAYNHEARSKYSYEIDSAAFKSSLPYFEKIIWLEGVWDSEDDQRNHSLNQARKDGIDFLIIQDLDEFYLANDFKDNLQAIQNNPDYPAYRCPWTVFWKTLEYVIQVREHEGIKGATVTTCPNFAVNVNYPDIKFSNRRLVNEMDKAFMLPGLCLHLAWVLSDNEVQQKIETWGHSHQFNHKKWFKQKWLAWTPSTSYIGHITRANYLKAVKYTGDLPVELLNFPNKKQLVKQLSIIEKADCFFCDYSSLFRVRIGKWKLFWLKMVKRNK